MLTRFKNWQFILPRLTVSAFQTDADTWAFIGLAPSITLQRRDGAAILDAMLVLVINHWSKRAGLRVTYSDTEFFINVAVCILSWNSLRSSSTMSAIVFTIALRSTSDRLLFNWFRNLTFPSSESRSTAMRSGMPSKSESFINAPTVVLTRLRSGLPTHLCSPSFKGQGAFSTQ